MFSAHSFVLTVTVPSSAVSASLEIASSVGERFLKACLDRSRTILQLLTTSPSEGSLGSPTSLISPTETILSVAAGAVGSEGDVVVEDDLTRLTSLYPKAITDFYGSGTPCVFKTGPEWPVAGNNSQKIVRAARPIYDHPIQPTWLKTAGAIADVLDSLQVKWNALDPLAYANAGEAELICEFVITIAVQPGSLTYDDAVAAAGAVNKILDVSNATTLRINKRLIILLFFSSLCLLGCWFP